ncbi:MAG: hypothetical protein EHM70_21210 [Chloroflexota bacterium]|nr:MAG: hypothetical protein EHM70_21210 [Chloroflexota bacterium]
MEKTFQHAATDLGLDTELRKISLSSMLQGGGDLTPKQREQIMALFNAYGTKFTPALLFGDEVRFAGKTPTLEQLKEALQGIAKEQS